MATDNGDTSEHWTIHAVNIKNGKQTRTAGSPHHTHRQHLNTSAAKTAGQNNAEWHGRYSSEDDSSDSLSWEADLVVPARRGTGWQVLGTWRLTREPQHHRQKNRNRQQRKQPVATG